MHIYNYVENALFDFFQIHDKYILFNTLSIIERKNNYEYFMNLIRKKFNIT